MRRLAIVLGLALLVTSASAEEPTEPEKPATAWPDAVVDAKGYTVHLFETTCNTFFVTCKATGEFVVIDAGAGISDRIREWIAKGRTFKACWVTHGHWDHISGLGEVRKSWEKIPIFAHEAVKGAVTHARGIWEETGFSKAAPIPPVVPDRVLAEGETAVVGKASFKLLHVPGHEPGSLVYVDVGVVLFAGDVLFKGTIGRTDLHGGDAALLARGFAEKLWDLDGKTVVLPGHGPGSTMEEERKSNWLFQDFVRSARGLPPIPRPWVGIGIDREREEPGVALTEISKDSPAEKAGLAADDVIVGFGEMLVRRIEDLIPAIRSRAVGDELDVLVLRDGKLLTLRLVMGTRPPPK